jgi:hypothetical protein
VERHRGVYGKEAELRKSVSIFYQLMSKIYILRLKRSDASPRSHRLYYVGALLIFVLFPYMGWELKLMLVFYI